MNNPDYGFWVGSILTGLAVASMAMCTGAQIDRTWKDEAVQRGCAEYYLEGSESKWRWKHKAEEEKP